MHKFAFRRYLRDAKDKNMYMDYIKLLEKVLMEENVGPIQRDGHVYDIGQFISMDGAKLHFPLYNGLFFPVCPLRPVSPRAAFGEIRWMLRGVKRIASSSSFMRLVRPRSKRIKIADSVSCLLSR